MNTVFKFYNQIWVLMALAAAALVSRMVSEVFPGNASRPALWEQRLDTLGVSQGGAGRSRWTGPHEGPAPPPSDRLRVEWARAGLVLTGLAVTASLLYPVLAIRPRLEQRFVADLGSGTLNALDWMEYGSLPVIGGDDPGDLSFAGDRAAIDWFNRNVAGSPVVAEASIGPYRCNGSRISIGTGLPTIIGWERHQQQQRYPETLGGRVADVRRLYDSPDPSEKLDIMARYDVAYVVVGPLERLGIRIDGNDCVASPEPAGIAALQAMVGTDLDVAFAGGGTTVYRVRSTA